MNFNLTMSTLVLSASTLLSFLPNPSIAQQSQPSKKTITYSRVRGWEAQLVQGTPNLARYYWEPMTRRTINTTSRTKCQAIKAPLPEVKHNPIEIHPPKSLLPPSSVTGKRLAPDAAIHTDTALVYKTTPSSANVAESYALDVSAQLASSKAAGKVLSKRALIAHQLSLTDHNFGK